MRIINTIYFMMRVGLLFLSLFGIGAFIYHKLKIHIAFIPILVTSSITTIMFLAGLLNFMPQMVWVIFILGIIAFFVYCSKAFLGQFNLKVFLHPSIIFTVGISIIFIFLLKGTLYVHVDDFSHWGLVVKEMFRIEGLPDSRTIISTFKNYPPGTAVFIYFVNKIIGYSESHTLMAQGFLVASALGALFAFSSWREYLGWILTFVASVVLLFFIRGNIYALLVDTFLGLLSLVITLIAYYYRNKWQYILIVDTPLLVLLILVKDSGKLFFIFNAILILMFTLISSGKAIEGKKEKLRKIAYITIFAILIPLFVNFLWNRYTEKAYSAESFESSKFAMSSKKFSEGYANKSDELKSSLGPKMLREITNMKSLNLRVEILLSIVLLLIFSWSWLKKRKLSKRMKLSFVYAIITYIIYMFSLYFMYLLVMPEGEAVNLASFHRYKATIDIYVSGIIMLALISEIQDMLIGSRKAVLKTMVTFLLSLMLITPYLGKLEAYILRPTEDLTFRTKIKSETAKIAQAQLEKSPLILCYGARNSRERGYAGYVISYEILTKNKILLSSVSTEKDKEAFFKAIKKANYLMIINSDKDFNSFSREFLRVENPSGVYKVEYKENKLNLIYIN